MSDHPYDSIVDLIGHTPLVRLSKVGRGVKPSIFAKLEFMNPGGSVKDRVGLSMILDAEKRGIIKPGDVIVEPTSGNTGAGLALVGVLRGYQVIFTVPDKMSREKIDLLKAYGAKVIVTPSTVSPDHPASYVRVAERIVKETPHSFMPNQYANKANPDAHHRTTGPEIWDQTGGKIDVLVCGVGTGGTISGTGRFLKKKNPKVKVVGVDPEGSLLHHWFEGTKGAYHSYRTEGIGEDFRPTTLDFKVIDEMIPVSDADAFLTARRLAREEGILAGGSSGAAVFGALKIAKKYPKRKVIVVILPDTGRNYLNKFYSDDWMTEYGYIASKEERIAVKDILRAKPKKIGEVISVSPKDSLEDAISLMKRYGISHLPVVKDGAAVGSIREMSVMKKLSSGKVSQTQSIEQVMDDPLPFVRKGDKILDVFNLLKDKNAALVIEKKKIAGIITTIDVINYLTKR
ncbi:MAG: cystathionine beta-synthase [Thaumarchaeota archaeon]|nr:cystathionine beta-synthase [Nitrososphaerota archaeon]